MTENVTEPAATELTEAVEIFDAQRRRLFGIAYRMLGSVSDAEDIVQDAWIRWQGADRSGIREPGAFLATVATRLSINSLQSARLRRETYIGPWLPEPISTDADPALGAERGEALQYAVLILLEKLTPTERAAYVLREAFDYPYARIAEVISTTTVNARQLVSRARAHLGSAPKAQASADDQRRLLAAFLSAAQHGDVVALENLLAEDVVSVTDGNGVKLAARIPVSGRARVAQFIASWSGHFWAGKEVDWVSVNGQPAAAVRAGGEVTTLAAITAGPHGIERVYWIMAPDKLRGALTARL